MRRGWIVAVVLAATPALAEDHPPFVAVQANDVDAFFTEHADHSCDGHADSLKLRFGRATQVEEIALFLEPKRGAKSPETTLRVDGKDESTGGTDDQVLADPRRLVTTIEAHVKGGYCINRISLFTPKATLVPGGVQAQLDRLRADARALVDAFARCDERELAKRITEPFDLWPKATLMDTGEEHQELKTVADVAKACREKVFAHFVSAAKDLEPGVIDKDSVQLARKYSKLTFRWVEGAWLAFRAEDRPSER
jgi:hypothetical protein